MSSQITKTRDFVLVSWVGVKSDPWELDRTGSPLVREGRRVTGPTLTLLTDPASPYRECVTDAVFFRQNNRPDDRTDHEKVHRDLVEALSNEVPSIRLHNERWPGEDPTDMNALFPFVQGAMQRVRRRFPQRELLVHLSPGTPSMQTVWVLLAEVGILDAPFTLVRSYRSEERRGRPAVVPVTLNLDTFYRRFRASRPEVSPSVEQSVRWDPARFQSPALRQLAREARRAAALRVPVLILGERGTGKTTLASWIRMASPFRVPARDDRWPAVACGQYTPETMRAELFGYKKGAFTGATHDHEGLLARADGDTLFLDEIGDVSRDLQRLLIRAVEEGRFQPLGAPESVKSAFRLVTATNIGLDALRARLDPDFLDRINSFTLRVPALREVPEDLDWMWDAALTEAAARAGVPLGYATMSEVIRRELLDAFRRHPLPGNLRDLFRVAWRYLAARADDLEPLPPREAIVYALEVLDGPETAAESESPLQDPSRLAAAAFAKGTTLPASLVRDAPFSSKRLIDDLHAWLAESVRTHAERTEATISSLIDRDERTLRTWLRRK